MRRVLIVSDDPFLRRMIRLSLDGVQAEFRSVGDATQMEKLCRRIGFDVVIVLMTAPFLCGRDLVRSVRPPGLRRPRIYVLSWQQSEQVVLSLLESGVDQYMTFPLSPARLRAKVSNELEGSLR